MARKSSKSSTSPGKTATPDLEMEVDVIPRRKRKKRHLFEVYMQKRPHSQELVCHKVEGTDCIIVGADGAWTVQVYDGEVAALVVPFRTFRYSIRKTPGHLSASGGSVSSITPESK